VAKIKYILSPCVGSGAKLAGEAGAGASTGRNLGGVVDVHRRVTNDMPDFQSFEGELSLKS
jgi:hypothetical protein